MSNTKSTFQVISKYEVAELLSTRAEQIAQGSKPFDIEELVSSLPETLQNDVYTLAQIEFYLQKHRS